MEQNTGIFFGHNLLKGWMKSFDFNGRTNFRDYNSFLFLNFGFILIILLFSFLFATDGFLLLIIYLILDILPMTSIAIRRLNDSGYKIKYLLCLIGFYGGWQSLRDKLSAPSYRR